jgi:DNA-binding MarR family transcriptional regulator
MSQAEELRRNLQRLFRRFGALSAESTPCGKPLGMAHAHALMSLRASGATSQQRLAAELWIDKSNVARLCAKLVEAGHARQVASKTDGRSRIVELTAKGERLALEVEAASKARFGALLGAVPLGRRAALLESLGELSVALDRLDPRTDGTHE